MSYLTLSIISPVLVLILGLFLSIYNEDLSAYLSVKSKPANLFTSSELEKFNSIDQPQLYLALLGKIFDVTKGAKHYGPGKTYNAFVGRDASRSFVTGKFNKNDLTDDVIDLTGQELLSLKHWVEFYKKDYTQVGKLIGRYFDGNGKQTQYNKEVKKLIKLAEVERQSGDVEKIKFPPCNVEWSQEQGSRVWCTKRSGGIERSWIGVPRKLFEPGSDSFRCACIKDEDRKLGSVQEYEGCDPNFDSCYVKT